MRVCLYAGSFDPPTVGHEDVVRRALALFDKVIVAVQKNDAKAGMYPPEYRAELLRVLFRDCPRVEIALGEGLTADLAREMGAGCLLRALRDMSDAAFEFQLAAANRKYAGLDTVFLVSAPEYACVSSTFAREMIRRGASLTGFVPDAIRDMLTAKEQRNGK